jgi:hypothetical protein
MACVWEEIHAFTSPGEYKKFCDYIEGQVMSGVAREQTPDPNYEKAQIFGGRWFEDIETKDIWRLVPPDFPFRGLWQRVEARVLDPGTD